jgi:hypothetical protein
VVSGKYPHNGQLPLSGVSYDGAPLGGFGGLGIVQLMTPIGSDNADGTNTVLDDNIDIIGGAGLPLVGANKQRFLAWRGFQDEQGVMVDDRGNPTAIGNNEGDIRPAPLLLPLPDASRSRARSRWQPLGATIRAHAYAPAGARSVIVTAGESLPASSFRMAADGSLPWQQGAERAFPGGDAVLASPAAIVSTGAGELLRGRPAHRLALAAAVLGGEADRYAGYLAEILDASGRVLHRYRVRAHDDRTLWLDPDGGLPATLSAVQLRAWFVDADFGLPDGAVATYPGAGGVAVPQQNVSIGLAFHRAPARALTNGNDPDRFPTVVGTFLHDLADPATTVALAAFRPTHLQWDVTFDLAYRRSGSDRPPGVSPTATMPSLRALLLPLRF